jgi:hypothetical protein
MGAGWELSCRINREVEIPAGIGLRAIKNAPVLFAHQSELDPSEGCAIDQLELPNKGRPATRQDREVA